ADGGRMVLPLTSDRGFNAPSSTEDMKRHGGIFLINRNGRDYTARLISPVRIIPAEGIRDRESEAMVAAAFRKGRAEDVTRLYRRADIPDERCWLRGQDWCLAWR